MRGRDPAVLFRAAKTRELFFLLLFSFCLPIITSAQVDNLSANQSASRWQEAGAPYLQSFGPKDYHGHGQNWSIAQDKRGLMYFGTNNGVYEFDGVSWRLIPVSDASVAFSVTCDERGRIYAGGQDEFGFLAADSIGVMRYVSLLPQVQEQDRHFGEVRSAAATDTGVFFQTTNRLFRWSKSPGSPEGEQGRLQVWRSSSNFLRVFVVGHQVFVQQERIGLMAVVGDSLQLIPSGETFAETRVYFMLPYGGEARSTQQNILIGARDGLFRFDGEVIQPFQCKPGVTEFLRANRLQHGALLSDGTIALSTQRGGVAIFDPTRTELRQILDKATGLRDVHVKFVYPDREGGLWLATNNGGIMRYETPSPLSIFRDLPGIENGVTSIARHHGWLYIATGLGVYYLQTREGGGLPVFKSVIGITAQSNCLVSADKILLAGTADGLYQITGERATLIMARMSDCLYRSPSDANRIYVALAEGVGLLSRKSASDEQWRFAGKLSGITEQIRYIAEDDSGTLWLATEARGVLRVQNPVVDQIAENARSSTKVWRYGRAHGLPEVSVSVHKIGQCILFATGKGLRRFDAASETFSPDSTFGASFADSTCTLDDFIKMDKHGRWWTQRTYQGRLEFGALLPRGDGAYSWQTGAKSVAGPLARAADFGPMFGIHIDNDDDGAIWLGSEDALLRFEPASAKIDSVEYPALIRRVTANGTMTIFGGMSVAQTSSLPTLAYANNALRFECAAPTFDGLPENRFQYFLEGFDDGWSEWTVETKKDYTNLPEGGYRFRVRAKNIYAQLSTGGMYEFTILPPWYRTWWAYALYATALIAGIVGMEKFRVGRLKKRAQKLEEIVVERTSQIAVQADKLKEMDRIKSRFFANISHEFRTPLTLIMGQIDSVLAALNEVRLKTKLEVAFRSAQQLLRLVNQLLDLSRLEAGHMELRGVYDNLVPLLKSLTSAFESLAQQKKISLRFHSAVDEIKIYHEPDKVEKIIYNLLSNACKFTPEGGKISVQLSVSSDRSPVTSNQLSVNSNQLPVIGNQLRHNQLFTGHCLLITVRDTGIGIPAEHLPHIFDRFYQVDSTTTREHQGTGIGLALTKELVELHGGEIVVTSEEGFGTTFVVSLPLSVSSEAQGVERRATGVERGAKSAERRAKGEERGAKSIEREATGDSTIHLSIDPELQHSIDPIIQPSIDPSIRQQEIVLIVEDNTELRSYIGESLENRFQILEAANGEEGLAKAQELVPDLVITDVMMPKLDGYGLCKILKSDERTSHIPIIVLTAKAEEADKLAGLEIGVDDYLTKPFSRNELRLRVRNLIEIRQRLRERYSQLTLLQPHEITATPVDQKFLERLQEIVEANLEEEDFDLNALSLKAGLSERQIERKLKALLNQSPSQFIRFIRLQRAKQLLEQNAGTVSEIAFRVGYNNLSHFSKIFREVFGILPSEVGKE